MPTRQLVLKSGLFDEEWYKLSNPYIIKDGLAPLTHFLMYGRKYRLSPSARFDTGRYLDEHEAARSSRLNPLVHYLRFGQEQKLQIHNAPRSDADRILASGLFDALWYLKEYDDVAKAGFNPLLHYLIHGWKEGRSPGPNFDAKWYTRRYPDIKNVDPLLHFIDHGREEGRIPLKPARVLEIARATLEDVESLEPDLYCTDYLAASDQLEIITGMPRHRTARAFEKAIGQIRHIPHTIVFLPWIVHGGADLVAGHAVRAISEVRGPASVIVILADHEREEALHLIPEMVQVLSFSRIDPLLSFDERVALVDLLIRSLRPSAVLNVNSGACWDAIKRHGSRLTHFTKLYAMLFCPDYTPSGRRSGYSDLYPRQCLPFLTGVYSDNHAHIEELKRKFAIPPHLGSRLTTLYQPVVSATVTKREPRKGDEPLKILWAGRFAAQKNIDLLVRIVTAAPQFEFHIWGRGAEPYRSKLEALTQCSQNVRVHGAFERFEALPLMEYHAFLYTSLWDGIPNVLLEAAAAQLPIVASHVGGIGELVDEDTGWLICDCDRPEPYVVALTEIANNPQRACQAVKAMSDRLQSRHNWDLYREVLAFQPGNGEGILYEVSLDNGSLERAS